jgi:hypothetical protein
MAYSNTLLENLPLRVVRRTLHVKVSMIPHFFPSHLLIQSSVMKTAQNVRVV